MAIVWTNENTGIFRAGDPPEFLGLNVNVAEIRWGNMDKAEARIEVKLPINKHLLSIKDGDTLEIIYREYGVIEDPSYSQDDIIAKMKNIFIQEKSIRNLTACSPDDYGKAITLNIFIDCELELNFES